MLSWHTVSAATNSAVLSAQLLFRRQESFQRLFFELFVTVLLDGRPDALHQMIVKIQVMKNAKSHAEHLFCL